MDVAFKDEDFACLFQDELDGIEESNVGKTLGMVNLAFDDWLKPFGGGMYEEEGDIPVHPYMDF